jgi:hypothetical protein
MNRIPNTVCDICDKPIYKKPSELVKSNGKAYCSQACFGISCRREVSCTVCGTSILGSKHAKTCSRSCANTARAGIKYDKSPGKEAGLKKDKAKTNKALRTWLASIRGNLCQACSYDKFVVVHHMIERCNGGTNEESNLLLLCSNCHAEIHHNIAGSALRLQQQLLGR